MGTAAGDGGHPLGAAAAEHKVNLTAQRPFAEVLRTGLAETFFPDDPFRGFKGQPLGTQWLMAVKYLFPILDWLPSYSFSLFKSDLISGLTIASLAIPQARICYSLFHASASPP